MLKARALSISVLVPIILIAPSPARGGELTTDRQRRLASTLRAQPQDFDTREPAWLVERGDNSSLRISLLSQTRYNISHRVTGFVPSGDTDTYGFSQPRSRVAIDGSIVSSQFNYRLSFDLGDAELSRGRGNSASLPGDTGSARMLDAYVQYNFQGKREGYYLKGGQFNNILLTEESIDSAYQLGIDRSLSSEIFGPGYTQGIALGRVTDSYAWEINVTDGGRYVGSRETDNSPYDSEVEADLALGGRFDWKLIGSWEQFADFTSFAGAKKGAKVGGGLLYQFHGQTNPGEYTPPFLAAETESAQVFTWTLDYQFEDDGWNFFAAYYGQWVDWEFANDTLGTLHQAALVQGGWFMTDQIEWYGRFETFWISKKFRNGFGLEDGYIHRIGTVGVNYYFIPESHAAKLSAEVSYTYDPLTVLGVGGGTIALPDPNVTGFLGLSDNELLFRVQLQLMF